MIAFVLSLSLPRHGESQVPQEGRHRTDEVFRDPITGLLTRVWVEPPTARATTFPRVDNPRGPAV